MQPGSTVSGKSKESLPEIGFCKEKHQLLTRFVEAVKEIGRLQQHQMQTVIDGEPEFDRLETLLHEASQRKDAAKYALLVHIEQHHC